MFEDDSRRVEIRPPAGNARCGVVVAGDVCPMRGGLQAVLDGGSAGILGGVRPWLEAADLRLVQFEAPLTLDETPIDKSGPNLRCPPGSVRFLEAGGFDVALLANNHIGDYGPAAVLQTLDTFRECGIATVGAGADLEAACRPLLLERAGLRLAVINAAEHEFGTAGPAGPGSAPLDPLAVCRCVRRVRSAADIVLVVTHGGNEYNPLPSPRVQALCRACIEAGAAAMVNIHPHCPQGIEVWQGAPIAYSLGNFFFPLRSGEEYDPTDFWWSGYLLRVDFDRHGAFGFELLPYILRVRPPRIEPLDGGRLRDMLAYLARISELAADPERVRAYFDAWCALHGPEMLAHVRRGSAWWPIAPGDRHQVRKLLALRNTFTCEAHCELVTNFLRLVEEGRVERAARLVPGLKRLQRAGFLA